MTKCKGLSRASCKAAMISALLYTEIGLNSAPLHTDFSLILHWNQPPFSPTANWFCTDFSLPTHWFQSDSKLISPWFQTDRTMISGRFYTYVILILHWFHSRLYWFHTDFSLTACFGSIIRFHTSWFWLSALYYNTMNTVQLPKVVLQLVFWLLVCLILTCVQIKVNKRNKYVSTTKIRSAVCIQRLQTLLGRWIVGRIR